MMKHCNNGSLAEQQHLGYITLLVHRYGKPSANDNEVHQSAEAASMHQTITQRFPKEYSTEVRGVQQAICMLST